MLYYLIMCRSVTYAQKIVKTLERAGIGAWLTRSPVGISPSGCSYSVRVSPKNISEVLRLLEQVKVPYMGIYFGSVERGYQEVSP